MVQLHPMHPPGYGPGYSITSGARYYCHLERRICLNYLGVAVQHNFRRTLLVHLGRRKNISRLDTAVQHNFRRALLLHPGRRGSIAWALRHSITSGARCYCLLGKRISIVWVMRYSIISSARCWCRLGRRISLA